MVQSESYSLVYTERPLIFNGVSIYLEHTLVPVLFFSFFSSFFLVLYIAQNGFCIHAWYLSEAEAESFVCFLKLSLLLDVLCKFYLVCVYIVTILFRLCFLAEMAQPDGTLKAKNTLTFLLLTLQLIMLPKASLLLSFN